MSILFYLLAFWGIRILLHFIGSDSGKSAAKQIYAQQNRRVGDFTISLLMLFAEVMKADGKILRSELNAVKQWLVHNYGESVTLDCLKLLKELLNQNTDLYNACERINASLDYSNRLQLIHCLFGIALADGEVAKQETYTIEKIANLLRISNADYITIQNMYFKNADSAYKILQVEKSATDEEVKKAYKKLCIKYHPDKVAHLGEEAQKAANEKFQKINEAFETIKKERNIN